MYDTIDSVLESGLGLGDIRTLLKTLHGLKKDDIEALIEENDLKSNRSTGFRDHYYDFLQAGTRTEDEVMEYIETGSANVVKDKNFHLAVWKLVEGVRSDMVLELSEAA